ncbi:hypothetical protein D1816_22620 [Aquimarina sp. AD10]|uniref:Uncharacterized protein n=1 Tax=Aquimarina aggregata TaxID=1642818 RepID=A0A163AM67_9FLAO|nr:MULTISPECIES: hypothetical protein [Aquimarina]AXT63017.1 hypothetical protein D1816_22620 [Aquimarina sp. AD10]KZS40645.1 hypothetical protein AWE51_06760 [Aquimarina aggregata]RKM96818.1 hypothetical protein D7033_14995 [Aquimarina sp. AD10]
MKLNITGLLLFVFLTAFGQTQKEKQVEREKNKVEIFTSDEKDNLQVFVAKQVEQMKLSEKLREEYYGILLYYTNKMGRIGDKNKGYTEAEKKTKLDAMVINLNDEVKEFLTEEQYAIHRESFGKIVTSVYNRKGWTKQ